MKKYVKIECVLKVDELDTNETVEAGLTDALVNVFQAESLTIEVLPATQLVQAQD